MKVVGRSWGKRLALPLGAVLILAIVVSLSLYKMSLEPAPVYASGVATSGVTTTGQDTTNDFTSIRFDIDWNNSWRDSVNWDAVWVFVKFSVSGGAWKHATLSSTAGHHSVTTTNGVGVVIDPASDGKGVFMYRSSTGFGTNNWDKVKLRWNYGADSVADDALVRVKVFAIEMVHIPQGEFDLGDGDGTNESVNALHSGDTNNKVRISTTLVPNVKTDAGGDAQMITGSGIGIDGDGGLDTNNDGTIDNANFPTGYNAFYAMKHEMSQIQYAEFLNTLTATQATNHDPTATANRQYIEVQAGVWGTDANGNNVLNEAADGQTVAANFVIWNTAAAYADWAGLRPLSETEWEKAARGPVAAVFGDYPWGTTQIASALYTLSNAGQASEVIATNYATGSVGNALYASTYTTIGGPARAGIFATGTSTRVEAGASYYGLLNMAGSMHEWVVNLVFPQGRAFTGLHGDGSLDANGIHNVSGWPDTSITGAGLRGGRLDYTAAQSTVSARKDTHNNFCCRHFAIGGRFARTAP